MRKRCGIRQDGAVGHGGRDGKRFGGMESLLPMG